MMSVESWWSVRTGRRAGLKGDGRWNESLTRNIELDGRVTGSVQVDGRAEVVEKKTEHK